MDDHITFKGLELHQGDKVKVTYYEKARENYFTLEETVVIHKCSWYFKIVIFGDVPLYRPINDKEYNGSVITNVELL